MEAIITYPKKNSDIKALKAFLKALDIEFEHEVSYKPSFVSKIKKAKKDYQNGEYITIKDSKNVWESILSDWFTK